MVLSPIPSRLQLMRGGTTSALALPADEPRACDVRSAVAEAARRFLGVPLFAGGKSFGARMPSQAQAQQELEGVGGRVFVGFPLHTAGKPSVARAAHLRAVEVPMLFLQGTRDALAELPLVRQVVAGLGMRATLHVVEGADHGFAVLKRSGRTPADVIAELADGMASWMWRSRWFSPSSGAAAAARPPA
jgi:uncharacterized protein